MSARRRGQRGFTLIELMVVLVLIAVLTMLATISTESGGSPRTTADRTTGMIQFARMRAEARRTIHRVRFETSQLVSIWESVLPDGITPRTGFTVPTNYAQIETMSIPSGVVLWAALPGVLSTPGSNPAQNLNFPFDIEIRPDGSTSGGTVFFNDANTGTDRYRLFVYTVTGTALAREQW